MTCRRIPALLLTCILIVCLAACAYQSPADQINAALATSRTTAPQTSAASSAASAQTTAAAAQTTAAAAQTGTAADAAPEAGEFVFFPSDGLDADGRFEGIRALDYVTLPAYKGIVVPPESHTPSDEAVDAEIDALMESFQYPEQIRDRAVADGDSVNIDFVGSIGGVEFQGGSTGGQGTTVTIGVTSYIDDFLEQLIGHKPGETVNVEVTFPDDYGNKDLAGKDALFVTVINYIEGEMLTPELNDAFVAENFAPYYGCTTVDGLREIIRDNLSQDGITAYIRSFLLRETEVREIPEPLLEYQRSAVLGSYAAYASRYGYGLDEFIAMTTGAESREALLESHLEAIEENARYALISQAVAEDAGLQADEAAMTAFFEETFGTPDYSGYIETLGVPYLRYTVQNTLVSDYLRENAVKG